MQLRGTMFCFGAGVALALAGCGGDAASAQVDVRVTLDLPDSVALGEPLDIGYGWAPADDFTTADTGGCSCKQITQILGIGGPHRRSIMRFGCPFPFINGWVNMLSEAAE